MLVLEQPTLPDTGVDVDPGDPLRVGIAGHRARALDALGRGGQALRDAGALAEVVVVGSGSVALDVGTGGLRRAGVELHPAVHSNHPDQASVDNHISAGHRASLALVLTILRSMRAD